MLSKMGRIVFPSLLSSVTLIALYFKVSFIVGSKMSFFNAYDLVSPVLGGLGFSWLAALVLVTRTLVNPISPFWYIVRHMPGLAGVMYWRTQSWGIRLGIPLICMALFLIHPVGRQAYAYSFYWLIPMIICLANLQGVAAQAFGSTFVVHALGSVIWLYTVPMSAAQWWALIPVVCVERCMAAGGMICVYTLTKAWTTYVSHFNIHEKLFLKKASKA